jgi:hypothetical protein
LHLIKISIIAGYHFLGWTLIHQMILWSITT